jgi:hypothetical protein
MHRYCDDILRPIVITFICRHHLTFQHDNARPQVTRICTQFLEAENVPVLPWPAYSPDMSPTEHVWDSLDQCVWQRVSVPANIQQLCIVGQHSTINSLINSMQRMCRIAWGKWWSHQILDWFSDPHPYFSFSMSVTNRCISVFSVIEIYRLRPTSFISIDWFPYSN